MKLRVLMAWQRHRKGEVIEPPPNVGKTLLALRWAGRPYFEEVKEDGSPPITEPQSQPVISHRNKRVRT